MNEKGTTNKWDLKTRKLENLISVFIIDYQDKNNWKKKPVAEQNMFSFFTLLVVF